MNTSELRTQDLVAKKKSNAMINSEHSEDPYWNKKAKSIILYSTYLHIFLSETGNLLPVEHI